MNDGKADDLAGRVKKAAGELADDSELKKEGRKDRAAGKTKKAVDDAADKVKDGVDRLKRTGRD